MVKALVIGAAGFVGGYLVRHLTKECRFQVFATKMQNEIMEKEGSKVLDLNILDYEAVFKVISDIEPDYIFHLAAQSSVALSWKKPQMTIDVNVKGCVNLLEVLRKVKKETRTLLIGSGEEYGEIEGGQTAIKECMQVTPKNIYAASKVCQNMLGKIYADAYHLDVIMVRAFNHIGPGQLPDFVVSDFCRQVALIEKGELPPVINVGNLSARRDFTDVRDVVKAYAMLIQKGERGETYNVGRGEAVAIGDILTMLLRLTKKDIRVEIDEKRLRPIDIKEIKADTSKLFGVTGWKPNFCLQETLLDTLDSWRKRV